jgi:hypothetical protein
MPVRKTSDLCTTDKFQECALRLGMTVKAKLVFQVVMGV